jgi:hypothetical protein
MVTHMNGTKTAATAAATLHVKSVAVLTRIEARCVDRTMGLFREQVIGQCAPHPHHTYKYDDTPSH